MLAPAVGRGCLPLQPSRRSLRDTSARGLAQTDKRFERHYKAAEEKVRQMTDAELEAQLEYMLAPEATTTIQYTGIECGPQLHAPATSLSAVTHTGRTMPRQCPLVL